MKASIIVIGFISIIFLSCKGVSNKDLTGVYATKTQSEYSIAYDTLVISAIDADKSYQIQEKIGFQLIKNGKLEKKLFKQNQWQATWDKSKNLLAETEYGKQIYFKPENNSLFIKSIEFLKIK